MQKMWLQRGFLLWSVTLPLFTLWGCGESVPTDEEGGPVEEIACSEDADCADRTPCNGMERCVDNRCESGTPVECEAGYKCHQSSGDCVSDCDEDGDGHNGESCGGDDCDDDDADRFPGNTEYCTTAGELDPEALSRDEDCDPKTLGDDADHDGYYRKECSNENSSGQRVFGVDCDDTNDLRRPGLVEVCDGIDNDCLNGLDFLGEDDDNDGYADCEDLIGTGRFDCNDFDPAVNPGVEEDLCDGVDIDCDGSPEDADADGYFATDATCVGEVSRLDCNDALVSVSPLALEECNGIDDDCSGTVDDNGANARSCGAVAAHGQSTCAGHCEVQCSAGFGDCDEDAATGCETSLRSVDNCGSCGNSCVWGCSEGACVKAVQVVGGFHTCALLETGAVTCWGANYDGETGVGAGSHFNIYAPTNVLGFNGRETRVTQLAAGSNHTCALLDTGAVKCWGKDNNGQLGDGDDDQLSEYEPVDVVGLDGSVKVVQLTGGNEFTCALLETHAVKCWGKDTDGELGDGDPGNSVKFAPVDVADLDGATYEIESISAGDSHACAVTTSGEARCWGKDDFGQLGDGPDASDDAHTAVAVTGLGALRVLEISAGAGFTCALLEDHSLKCWGGGSSGKLGNGASDMHASPTSVTGLDGVQAEVEAIAAGMTGACALLSTGAVRCWGSDSDGQLGDGGSVLPSSFEDEPVGVDGIDGIAAKAIALKTTSSPTMCALMDDGDIKCWGLDTFGGVGDGFDGEVNEASPVEVLRAPPTETIVQVSGSRASSCAIQLSGRLNCWGYDYEGALGDGGSFQEDRDVPASVRNVGGTSGRAIHVATGGYGGCVVMQSGAVQCWGSDEFGGVGDADDDELPEWEPVEVIGLDGSGEQAIQVAAGAAHRCALFKSGAVKCWGSDTGGQSGDGEGFMIAHHEPVQVEGLDGEARTVTQIAAGGDRTCALLSSGMVECWGRYAFSEDRHVPQEVPGLAGVLQVALGDFHTCALLETGAVKCWGSDLFGQLGDGAANNDTRYDLVEVSGLGGIDTRVVQIAAGAHHTCAVLESGEAMCWGQNDSGQIGDGFTDTAYRYSPVSVQGLNGQLSRVVDIAAGSYHTCAALDTFETVCWGSDASGQLGDGDDGGASEFAPVTVLF